MMRSFGARPDCGVIDEPFFAPFLNVSGKAHPGRAETLEAHETDPDRVAKICAGAAPNNETYFFQKHMPHHMLSGFPMDWAKRARHFFLIREPARVIASYAKGRAKFEIEDLGFSAQRRLYDQLTTITGKPPPIIDSTDILRRPEPMLRALCAALDMPFDTAMLSWESGPRPEDGAWAPYWYASVETSTGFSAPPSAMPDVPNIYTHILAACEADYAFLRDARIQIPA
jgi:hypothetical protein